MIYVIYHGGCQDGFMAAWIASVKHKNASFIGEKHGEWSATKYLIENVQPNDEVYYFDICPPKNLYLALRDKNKNVEVHDHHLSAERECGKLPGVYIDKEKSGATLAFQRFFRGMQVPLGVRIVEDIDLYKKQIPNSEKFIIFINMLKQQFDVYDKVIPLFDDEESRAAILETCENMLAHKEYLIRRVSDNLHEATIAGVKFLAINSGLFQSEIGDHLSSTGYPVAIYAHGKSGWYVSLRSKNPTGIDVSAIAEKFNGGGHKHAAAFKLDDLSHLNLKSISFLTDEELDSIPEYRNAN